MPDFVHLHNHTDYSLLDGAAPIDKMVEKAVSFGMKHLAITDHGNMFGVLRFYKACKAHEINPLIGCEVYVAPGSRHVKTEARRETVTSTWCFLPEIAKAIKTLSSSAAAAIPRDFTTNRVSTTSCSSSTTAV